MKVEDRYFDVTPQVVPADRNATITIAPRFDHCRFRQDRPYELTYCPMEEFAQQSGWVPGQSHAATPVDGVLRFDYYFEGEQEHVLYLEEVQGTERKRVGDFRVYSLGPDLFARKPYKGDFHMHSCRSDGWETPAYVAAASRKIGMDFMAVTDHRKYTPSIEAQEAFAGVPIDLRICRGEEVHPPNHHVHIINFAGAFSINELFDDDAAYRAGVRAVEDRLPAPPPGVDRYTYASCVWCFEKIREAGGLGVFCHPYWVTQHRYSPAGPLTTHMFDQRPFDAFELIGGFHRWEVDSNTLHVARYHEERAQGRPIPIVGASDSHGCERGEFFGWYYSIVFSPTPDPADVVDSVKRLYSVAVEALPGETPRAYGPFRLVKYALFLLREIFPRHDELCIEEGRLMIEHVAGSASASESLRPLQGRTAAHLNDCWGQ